jgi:hypothetical protein
MVAHDTPRGRSRPAVAGRHFPTVAAVIGLLAAAAGARPEDGGFVIPETETATIRALLPSSAPLPGTPCRLGDVSIRGHEIEVRCSCPSLRSVSLTLVHPDDVDAGGPHSRFFGVRPPARPEARAVADALAAFLAAREKRSPWVRPIRLIAGSRPGFAPAPASVAAEVGFEGQAAGPPPVPAPRGQDAGAPASLPVRPAPGPERPMDDGQFGQDAGTRAVAAPRTASPPAVTPDRSGTLAAVVAVLVLGAAAWLGLRRRRRRAAAGERLDWGRVGRWALALALGFGVGATVCEVAARRVFAREPGRSRLTCNRDRCRLGLAEPGRNALPLEVRSFPDGVDYWFYSSHDREDASAVPATAAGTGAPRRHLVLIGDSVAYGVGVGSDESFAHHLGQAFGPGVAVTNLAVPGHDFDQHRVTAAERLPALHPDLVLLCVWLDDLTRKAYGPLGAYRQWSDHRIQPRDPLLVRTAWGRALVRHSRFAELAVLRGLRGAEWLDRGGRDADQHERGRAALQSIADSTRKAGGRLVVVVMAPMRPELYLDRSPRGDVGFYLAFIGRALGPEVPVLDARDLLGPISVEEVRLDDCCHLNPAGHRQLGAALAAALRRLGFPDPAAATTQRGARG